MTNERSEPTDSNARAKEMGCEVVHHLRVEPWGVRRFFIVDPTGKLLNVLSHGDK